TGTLHRWCVPETGRLWPAAIGDAEVLIGKACRDASTRGAGKETQLQEIWLVDILDGLNFFAGARRQCLDAYRPTVELFDDRAQDITITRIKSTLIYLQRGQRQAR